MFALSFCFVLSTAENLSPVVASVAQTVSSVAQTVAVVGPGTIAVVAVVGISIGLGSGGGLSISGPLAVVEAMTSVRVSSIGVSSVAQTVVSQTITIDSVVGISIGPGSGGGLSISGPLAVVGIRVSSVVSGVSSVAQTIGVRVGVVAVVG